MGDQYYFHLIISLFYPRLLYHNITSCTSPNITLVLLFISCLLSVKWNFVFALTNGGPAKTWPTGPSATALCSEYNLGNACVVQSVIPSVRVLVSHFLVHVDYYLTELAIPLLKLRKRFHRSILQMLCSTTQIRQWYSYCMCCGSQIQHVSYLQSESACNIQWVLLW